MDRAAVRDFRRVNAKPAPPVITDDHRTSTAAWSPTTWLASVVTESLRFSLGRDVAARANQTGVERRIQQDQEGIWIRAQGSAPDADPLRAFSA